MADIKPLRRWHSQRCQNRSPAYNTVAIQKNVSANADILKMTNNKTLKTFFFTPISCQNSSMFIGMSTVTILKLGTDF